jgi:hypothetical protein
MQAKYRDQLHRWFMKIILDASFNNEALYEVADKINPY